MLSLVNVELCLGTLFRCESKSQIIRLKWYNFWLFSLNYPSLLHLDKSFVEFGNSEFENLLTPVPPARIKLSCPLYNIHYLK